MTSFKEQHESYSRPIKICGIYCITNILTQKKYIGKSTDVSRRWREHRSPSEWRRNPNKSLYKGFEQDGIENFDFQVLEECSKKDLNKREKYWIQYYNTFYSGYNNTFGGDGANGDDEHPNHKLSLQDVVNIRKAYANHERKILVEERYRDKIGHSGFHKIWNGTTWPDVMPEVFTNENKDFHRNNTGCPGSMNGRALLNEKDVYNIRVQKKDGRTLSEVYEQYKTTGITKGSFERVWYYDNWKSIVVD